MTDTKAHATDTADTPAPPAAVKDAYESDFTPVIRSKIQPPPLRSTTLTRQRLIDRLHEATQSRLTLLVAEAGYGKTTLLADFAARSGQRTLWYRLDPTDADSITWTNYLIAACREVDPSFGTGSLRLLSPGSAASLPKSAYIEALAGEITNWSAAPTTLVLDDFHQVDQFAEVSEVMHRLIEAAPTWLHIIISTRRRPPLELARLAAQGDLAEIGSQDLRFSDVETSRLFAECYGRPLDREVVQSIDRRTMGWAASLGLLYSSIRDKSIEATVALAEELSGASGPIYDYLAEEVLSAIPGEIESMLVRASLLDSISTESVLALFARDTAPPVKSEVLKLLDQAEGLGLLARASRSSDRRELHPLLRDFLLMRLRDRIGADATRLLHRDVAIALTNTEPLAACRHFIQAGATSEAMTILDASILKTIGSGSWGLAVDLVNRLRDVPPGPGVAAIRARQLMDDGDLVGAERLLEHVNAEIADPPVRSALRLTELNLGWRTGDRDRIRSAARALLADHETPESMREIAQLFFAVDEDASGKPALTVIAARLVHMSERQAANGLDFFSAVALHNAAFAYLAVADYEACLAAVRRSFNAFSRLPYQAVEALSTHSVAAVACMESGRDQDALSHVAEAMGTGRESADVPAAIAVAYISAGRNGEAKDLIARARSLEKQGRGDVAGSEVTGIAEAFSLLAESPLEAIARLEVEPDSTLLDLGLSLDWRVMLAHAYLAAGQARPCIETSTPALDEARRRSAHRSELRLALLLALGSEDKDAVAVGIRRAASDSRLALSELADVICRRLDLANDCLDEIGAAVDTHPRRWLPFLRQALGRGAPAGHHAAYLIDIHGESRDVAVLRAYARTYRDRGAPPRLGIDLARRTSPRLRIHDLGRVILEVGGRSVSVSGMRRKPAALLLYLVSRSAFTAHRDQVIDDLWPDADPASAINSLNQSLYFLRREIDPWYEDGVSPDYIGFAGDLVWLDADLVISDGAEFLTAVQRSKDGPLSDFPELLGKYTGHFAPEFEYEEWALAFRSKLKSKFLETASSAIGKMIRAGDLDDARSVATLALEADETAFDLERTLIWLHWRLGARSAAKAQFEHLLRVDQLDGLDPVPLLDLVEGPAPLGAQ